MRTRTTRLIGDVGSLALASSLVACAGSSSDTSAPLSNAVNASDAKHPEWSKYTFTIGDNGGDGSQELAKVTGVPVMDLELLKEKTRAVFERMANPIRNNTP